MEECRLPRLYIEYHLKEIYDIRCLRENIVNETGTYHKAYSAIQIMMIEIMIQPSR